MLAINIEEMEIKINKEETLFSRRLLRGNYINEEVILLSFLERNSISELSQPFGGVLQFMLSLFEQLWE